MIEHYLDGTQVFPAAGEKIQITSENAILTKSGSYTLEVKFPLSIYQNREFFGDLNRIDLTKKVKTWAVEIHNQGNVLLKGTATLTKTTEDTIYIQYLAGNSQVNFWNNAENIYIDEYDYNTNGNGEDRVESWKESVKWMYDIVENYYRTQKENGGENKVRKGIHFFYKLQNYKIPQRPTIGIPGEFVFCNVYDEDYSWDKDTYEGREIRVGNGTVFERVWVTRNAVMHIIEEWTGIGIYASCIQPHLLFVIKKVIENRGYKLTRNDIENLPYINEMYIASARQTLKIADALPHWTIKEFIEQLENFFNCIVVFKEEEKECEIILRKEIANGETVLLKDIQDTHEEVIQEEKTTSSNILSSNIRYKDIGKEGAVRCDDATRKKYGTIWGDDVNDLWQKAQGIKESERIWRFYRIKSTGFTYGLSKGGEMLPIDYLCPINRNSENYFDLKILPARTAVKYYPTGESNGNKEPANLQTVLTMTNGWGGYECIEGDIVQEVLGQVKGKTRRDKEDYMPVFFYNGHKPGGARYTIYHSIFADADGDKVTEIKEESTGISIPVGDPYTGKYWNTSYGNYRKNFSLALVAGHTDVYHGQVFEGLPKINMETELQEKFLAVTPPSPRAVFYIHNKKYLCSKIEYEIDENGIIPLMTGYFHEVVED